MQACTDGVEIEQCYAVYEDSGSSNLPRGYFWQLRIQLALEPWAHGTRKP